MKFCYLFVIFPMMLPAQPEGMVINAATGAPIAGAYVSTYDMNDGAVKTDVAGHFRFPAKTGPITQLKVIYPGFLSKDVFPKRTAGAKLRIELTPAAAISGKIEDEDGFAVEGAQVEPLLVETGGQKVQLVSVTQTDDLGRYRIGALAAGRYVLRVSGGAAGNWDGRFVPRYFPGTLQQQRG